MDGAVCIVNVAAVVVAEEHEVFETTQRYWYVLIDVPGAVSKSDDDVAPEYTPPLDTLAHEEPVFSCHW